MAAPVRNSLKIVNSDGSINEGGYVAVVKNIVFKEEELDEFVGEDDDPRFSKARTRKLLKQANSDGGILTQNDHEDTAEPVSPKNCRIRAQLDTRKTGRTGFSKITISLPEENLVKDDLKYIDDYIAKFLAIRKAGAVLPVATSDDTADKARMFMFGAMLLTKCR